MGTKGKNLFRKVLAVLATLTLTITGLSLGVSPASAVQINIGQPPHTYEVGTAIDVDVSCKQSYPGETVGASAAVIQTAMPDGLTLDPDWHIRGIPLTVQTVDVGFIRCFSGTDDANNWLNVYIGEFVIIPASTPNPAVTIANLNNAACDARIVAALPAFSDAGTLKLELSNEFGAYSFTLRDYAATELIDLTVSALDVATLGSNANVLSQTVLPNSESNFCNTSTTATISYQHLGAPLAYGWAVATPTKPAALATTPSLVWSTLGDSACTVHLSAVWPSLQDGATPHLYVATGYFGYDIWLSGVVPGSIVNIDLPLMNPDAFANGDVLGIDHFTIWGDAPTCTGNDWQVNSDTRDANGNELTTYTRLYPELPAVAPAACVPGTYSNTGAAPCADAAPGYFVDKSGATEATACGLGFYSDTSNSVGCTPAAKGRFVASTAANSSIACGAGKNTRMTAARSAFECYTLRVQTVKAVKVLKTYKYGTKVITPTLTDGGRALTASAVGKCTVAVTKVTVKVKGKSTRVNRYQIVAAKSAGNCSVTYTNAGDEDFASLRVVKTFKVSKTGK